MDTIELVDRYVVEADVAPLRPLAQVREKVVDDVLGGVVCDPVEDRVAQRVAEVEGEFELQDPGRTEVAHPCGGDVAPRDRTSGAVLADDRATDVTEVLDRTTCQIHAMR